MTARNTFLIICAFKYFYIYTHYMVLQCIHVIVHIQGYTKEFVRVTEHKRNGLKSIFQMCYAFLHYNAFS